MDNTELLRKADLAVSDLASDGGKLNPEQSATFLRKLIVQPTLLAAARFVPMTAPDRYIDKIGFASRILRPAVSATALDAGARVKPTTERIQLTTKEVIAEVHIPYDVIEDAIENADIGLRANGSMGEPTGGIKDTIMDLIAERTALDLEELALLGDTTLNAADPYLDLCDGWLKLADENVVDNLSAGVSPTMFTAGLQEMPQQYLRNVGAMRHYISKYNELAYRDVLAGRETTLGDSQIQGTNVVFGAGVQVEPVALMPNTKGLLTYPKNLIFGMQRDIHVETDKDIRSRVYIIVVTARVAFQIEEAEAVVRYDNI